MGDVGPSVPAGLLPTRHAFDGRYSNVGTRLVLHPDPRSSRTASGRGTRAEASQSAALRRDAIAARMGQSLSPSPRVLEDWLAIDGTDTADHDPN